MTDRTSLAPCPCGVDAYMWQDKFHGGKWHIKCHAGSPGECKQPEVIGHDKDAVIALWNGTRAPCVQDDVVEQVREAFDWLKHYVPRGKTIPFSTDHILAALQQPPSKLGEKDERYKRGYDDGFDVGRATEVLKREDFLGPEESEALLDSVCASPARLPSGDEVAMALEKTNSYIEAILDAGILPSRKLHFDFQQLLFSNRRALMNSKTGV